MKKFILVLFAALLIGPFSALASSTKSPPKPTPGEVRDIHIARTAPAKGAALPPPTIPQDQSATAGVDATANKAKVTTPEPR